MRRQRVVGLTVLGAASAAVLHCAGPEGTPAQLDVGQRTQASETVMVPTSISTSGRLGQGRNLMTEELRSECVRASVVTVPTQQASLRFDSAMSQDDASRMLGFDIDAKARFGLVNASARSKFSRSLTNKTYSTSLVYSADYNLGVQKLDEGSLQWLVTPGGSDWLTRCGDEFMLQKEVGGQLFLLYRIDFSSLEAKQDFEASVGVSFTAGSVNANVTTSSSRFSRRAAVHVEAFQYGGDVTQLSSILGGSPSAADGGRFVDCSMDNLTACGNFMQHAIDYASAQGAGTFSDSLRNMPADRTYLFKDWGMLGVSMPVRAVGAEIKSARYALQQRFDSQVEFQDRVAMLQSGRLYVHPSLSAKLGDYAFRVQRNLDIIADAVKPCYDQITDPQDPAQIAACTNAASDSGLAAKGYDFTLTMDVLQVDVRLPYVFGGMYQVDDYRSGSPNDVRNFVTNTLGCGPGFTAMRFGRIRTPETKHGANQYLCVAPYGQGYSGIDFSGAYQADDRGNVSGANNVFNTYGGTGLGCTSPFWFGRATGPESGWGVVEYVCSTSVSSSDKMPIGGMYQKDDCNTDNVVNPLTGGLGCPEGFTPVQMSRVKMPEGGQCGGVQFVCKAQ